MWIRNQDKTELVNTQRIQVELKHIYAFESVAMDDCNYIKMGTYESKEKALKVLDYIQNQITNISREVVYEMPKEEM